MLDVMAGLPGYLLTVPHLYCADDRGCGHGAEHACSFPGHETVGQSNVGQSHGGQSPVEHSVAERFPGSTQGAAGVLSDDVSTCDRLTVVGREAEPPEGEIPVVMDAELADMLADAAGEGLGG
jgi:hypothetical protein